MQPPRTIEIEKSENVKGTLFIDFVKTIRKDKTGAYNTSLSTRDREVIEQRILPSSWYPYDVYKTCFRAVLRETGTGNPDIAREWGRKFGRLIMTRTYAGVHRKFSPCDTLRRYRDMFPLFYSFGAVSVVCESESRATLSVHEFDPDFDELYQLFAGWIEQSIELIGAHDVVIAIRQETDITGPVTHFDINYTVDPKVETGE